MCLIVMCTYSMDAHTLVQMVNELHALQVVPIIHIEGFGDRAAEVVCQQMKITSQNDTKKLAEAKAAVYLKGFTLGVLAVGPHKGKKVGGCSFRLAN